MMQRSHTRGQKSSEFAEPWSRSRALGKIPQRLPKFCFNRGATEQALPYRFSNCVFRHQGMSGMGSSAAFALESFVDETWVSKKQPDFLTCLGGHHATTFDP
jgi:hypothetical protein